ncbi:threonine/serine ThrE exporter family protein [Helicobacter himalayensis]|uniref:threonine/serine ThrE exporter family protein n=1 Tax=Helicobacter himalayensis TaxID=1591088 RepID=UPI0009ED6C74|nr:threonine/serine exporter family protein [Helicobacter himalayensis]
MSANLLKQKSKSHARKDKHTKDKQNHKGKQNHESEEIEELSVFLVQYAAALLSNGAYSSRVSRCTKRIGESYGYDVNMIIWLKNITLSISERSNHQNRRTQVSSNPPLGANFRIISDLSALSWQIYDEKISLTRAKEHFKNIMESKNYTFFYSLLFASLANTAFCKLFGGDVGTLLCVFLGTFAGFASKHILTKRKIDVRGIYVLVAFISSFVAYIGVHFGITSTPEIAIGLSILYLIPGIQIINALADVLHEYTLMALSRGVNMVILLICISFGAYMTLSIAKVSLIHV